MDVGLKDFSNLVELIYDAGVNPTRWAHFLAALSKAFECASGLLHRYDPKSGTAVVVEEFGHDETFSKSYIQYYADINPYPAESFQKLAIGKVDYAGSLLAPNEVVGTEFYGDWMRPQGISPNHLGVVLSRSGGGMSLLCVAPQARVFDKNPKRFRDHLQLLVPHMAKALELNRIMAGASLVQEVSNAMLDSIPAGVFLVSDVGNILFANGRAEKLIQDKQPLVIDIVTRKLRPFAIKECERFDSLLKKAAAEQQPQFMRLVAGESGAAFILALVPLSPRGNNSGSMPARGAVAVIATASSCHIDLRIEDIRAATGLSQAEARLARALVSGATISEYAGAIGLSTNTVRRQLAASFLKTETNRQSELIALLIRTIGLVALE